MAPELVFGEQPIDGRTDLYSLACAAYWALTGQLVFKANTPAQMLLHHAQTQPVLPSAVSELPIPGDLETLLMQCLEKDPAKRPASALTLDARLARIRCAEPWTQDRARGWWDAHAHDDVLDRVLGGTRTVLHGTRRVLPGTRRVLGGCALRVLDDRADRCSAEADE
jgi:serine/threonine protein kinase